MKIICEKSTLAENINIVSKAVSSRTTLSILECILLIADEKGFRLIGNDLEMGIETTAIEAQVLHTGSVALEARIFSDIIRRLPDAEVTIDVDDKNVTVITCGKSEFKILGQPGAEFPFLTTVEKTTEYRMRAETFRDMIKQTIFSVAVDDSKPVMMGELLEISQNAVKLVAVDGFRISVRTDYSDVENQEMTAVVPGKALNEISKVLSGDGHQMISLYATDKHMLFELSNCMIVTRLLEGDFIQYENLFTDDYTTLVTVNRDEMLMSLDRASLISKDTKKNPIKLSIENDRMIITSNTEIGTSHEEVSIETDGIPIDIAFNPRYLMEALKAMEHELITIQFTTPLSPCIIKAVTEEGEAPDLYRYLILPLRIKN